MNIISPLIRFQEQLRIFHWQTTSYAEHKAFGKTYENLGELFDSFVETYSGKYKVPTAKLQYDIKLENYTVDTNVIEYVNNFISHVIELRGELNESPELQNILDEITAEVQRLKYLLALK
jgi:DNA-binding ferritin-like protein